MALPNIEQNRIAGAGIPVNLIYLKPRAMRWQIPLLQQLCSAGVSQELTTGAGVPSIEVANEYIEMTVLNTSRLSQVQSMLCNKSSILERPTQLSP